MLIHTDVQAALALHSQETGCMCLVQVDDISPMVREWALWGIRNLCEGNEAVQQAIVDLQPLSPVLSPDLHSMGITVEMDAANGKVSIVRQAQTGMCPV